MTVAIDSNDTHDLTSFVTVRHARYNYSLTPRRTEITAIDRRAFGGRHLATNAAAAVDKKNLLKCSDCGSEKHFELFPVSTNFLYRHGGRGYQCNACQKQRRDELKASKLALKMQAQLEGRQNKKAKKRRK